MVKTVPSSIKEEVMSERRASSTQAEVHPPLPVYTGDRQTQVGTEDLPFCCLALRRWSKSNPKTMWLAVC